MVQLKVLSGKKAGAAWVARRFPVQVGRAAASDLQLEEPGVWDQHLRLDLDVKQGVVLHAAPNAIAAVNNQPVQEALLRNGDIISLGSARLQFELSETGQSGLRFREALTWICIGMISLGQLCLICWMLR